MTRRREPVTIGEAKTAGAGTILYTLGLGSCVAIVLFDGESRRHFSAAFLELLFQVRGDDVIAPAVHLGEGPEHGPKNGKVEIVVRKAVEYFVLELGAGGIDGEAERLQHRRFERSELVDADGLGPLRTLGHFDSPSSFGGTGAFTRERSAVLPPPE